MGFPIRRSSDHSSFAAPQGLSQRTTSFIASQRQGIHQMLFRHLIALMIHARRKEPGTAPTPQRLIRKTVPGSLQEHACRTQPVTTAKGRSWCRGQSPKPVMFPLHDVKHPQSPPRGLANPKPSGRRAPAANPHCQPHGGARRDRTDDLKLAKLALSQLSYGPGGRGEWPGVRPPFATPQWWAWDDSNVRPHPYQGCALTT